MWKKFVTRIFNLIYNFCKTKLLPNSVLAQNRLFIERHAQTRRIMSNFGVTFRSSKWSHYSQKNVERSFYYSTASIKTVLTGLTLLFLSGGLLFLVTYFTDGVINVESVSSTIFNTVARWIATTEDLWSCHFGWVVFLQLIPLLLHSLVNTTIHLFWKAVDYSLRKKEENPSWTWDDEWKRLPMFSQPLTTTATSLVPVSEPTTVIEMDEMPELVLDILKRNPKLTTADALELCRLSYRIEALDPNTTRPVLNDFARERLTPRFNGNEYLRNSSLSVNVSGSETSYHNLGSYDATTGRGIFYINSWDYNVLNNCLTCPELRSVTQTILNQNSAANTMRWAYRYSNLHRKSFIASHKLTLAKRLLGTGFYDSTLFNRNVWMSDQFSSSTSAQLSLNMWAVLRNGSMNLTDEGSVLQKNDLSKGLQNREAWGAHWNLLYGATLPVGRESGKTTSMPFHLLSHYEASFHFFLKRSYLFTSLDSINVGVTDHYNVQRGGENQYLPGAVDVQSLALNSLNRQVQNTSGLELPRLSKSISTNTATQLVRGCEVRKDLSNLRSRHNILTGATLEAAINLSQATPSRPSASLFYSLLPPHVIGEEERAPETKRSQTRVHSVQRRPNLRRLLPLFHTYRCHDELLDQEFFERIKPYLQIDKWTHRDVELVKCRFAVYNRFRKEEGEDLTL